MLLGELRANDAPTPGATVFPGLHLDFTAPGIFVAYAPPPTPLGPAGLAHEGITLPFVTPTGLQGSTIWLQAVALSPLATNGLAWTRALQVRMP